MSPTSGRTEAKRRWTLPRGRVLRRTCQDVMGLDYFVYVPKSGGSDAPLFVAVHGTSRNARNIVKKLSALCEQRGVVMIAPLFVGEPFDDYQRLGRVGRGSRADAALTTLIGEAARLTGASAARIHLFGQSGGAQFAHRYTMAHPHRVAAAVFVASGWYTFPDARERYPYGIRRSRKLPDVRFDPEEFLRIPITVMVGEKDTGTADLRRTKRVNRQQGATRVERANRWVAAMHAAAEAYRLKPLVAIETIADGDHSFTKLLESSRLGERVFAALFGNTEVRGADVKRG